MKQSANKLKLNYKFLFAIALTFAFINCGTIDNFDSDAFNLFGDENKSKTTEFRRYSENKLNQPPLIEFVIDYDDPVSGKLNRNLKKICDYTKLPYKTTDIKTWDGSTNFSASTRVLCMAGTSKCSDAAINKITEFVANGGTFFLPNANEDKRLAFLLGFKPEAEHYTDITAKGIYFKTPVLPSLKDIKITEKEIHFGFAKEDFSKNIKILATAINDPKYPTIVENTVGKGRVLLYNTQKAFEKRDRGLLFSGILKGLEGIPYPIANTSTIFLDDFPCPLFDIKSEPIASEMNLSSKDFVKKVWWPDMLKIAKKYNISYSVMITFDYKNKVQPPFLFDQWDKHKIKSDKKMEGLSDWFVYDAAKNGHELAFHGYNHVQLLKNLWRNQDFIATSLKSAQKKWEVNNFGELPITYVPPSNYIDNMGINQLKKTMPSLKYLCSSYNGETYNGENREFDFDPYNQDFFNYPRTTSGFYFNVEEKYSLHSAYLFTGIWTNFVHPDDVYQISNQKNAFKGNYDSRNPLDLGWYKTKGKNIGMYTEFDKHLKEMTTIFPQIRFLNAGEAANIVLDWRASNFGHNSKNGIYTVQELNPEESISGNQYWFLYVSSENSKQMETALQNQVAQFSKTPFLNGFLYTINTKVSKLSLPDLNYKTDTQQKEVAEIIKKVKNDLIVYQEKVKQFNIGEKNGEDDYATKFKLEIESLKQKMLAESKIDSVTWNKYTKYMTWEDKGIEVWKLLENHCVKYPIPENIMYSKQLNIISEYPNDLIKEKWMCAQMLVTPNDAALLNDYIATFYTSENQEKIKNALINLLKIDTSFDTYQQYIQHLLTYEPKTALVELSKVQPSEKFKSLATDISWLYSDDNQFKKAYDWSAYSDEIDFSTKMSWLIELKLYKVLEEEYKKYITKNDSDYKAKSMLSNVNHDIGKFKEAWVLANSLPESAEKENLRALLNKDVIYVETELQQDLLENYSKLFYPEVKQALIKTNRRENGDFIAFDSSLESNKKDPSAFKNVVSYNFLDKKKNLHGFGVTFSKMHKLNYEIEDDDNVTHMLYGLQYQYNNPKSFEKLQYWSRIRGDYSDFDKFYFQFGVGANFSKNKKYTSAEFKIFPAETGPAYSKNIYRMQGNLYHDAFLFGILNASLSFEANYYTGSKSETAIKTSDSYQISATSKTILDSGAEKKSKLLPFIEASYLKSSIGSATIDPSSGYPYWIIGNRFYAGGGLGWKFGKEDSDFNSRLEAAWFYDDYSDDFKRFMGEMSYQIFDYTAINVSFELYSQSKFYSNVIQFGVKYNLKKKAKK